MLDRTSSPKPTLKMLTPRTTASTHGDGMYMPVSLRAAPWDGPTAYLTNRPETAPAAGIKSPPKAPAIDRLQLIREAAQRLAQAREDYL